MPESQTSSIARSGRVMAVAGARGSPAARTVADARELFTSSSVGLVPALDGAAYVGAATR